MEIGMLWYDNDSQQELAFKVKRAADHYRKKYGEIPSLCFVHPSMVALINGSDKVMAGSVEIRTAAWVLPNHFWIGLNGSVAEG